jgi:hypothetical protein
MPFHFSDLLDKRQKHLLMRLQFDITPNVRAASGLR